MSDVLKAIGFIPQQRVVDAFLQHFVSGVQFIPVTVDVDGTEYHDFSYMNVFAEYPLLDIKASQARDYSERRDSYLFIKRMVFTTDKLAKADIRHDIFRVKEYPDGIIITDKIKDILDKNQITGLVCFPVEVV